MPLDDMQKALEVELAWEQHLRLPVSRNRSRVRERLAEAQNWRCCYCGVRMNDLLNDPDEATLEHIVPRALGGTDDEDNLAVACRYHNELRGDWMYPVHQQVVDWLKDHSYKGSE